MMICNSNAHDVKIAARRGCLLFKGYLNSKRKVGSEKNCQILCVVILQPFLAIFFCQLHKYLSQNLDADGHFEVLNV